MRSSLRASWIGIQASYWFIPALLTLAAFLLALVTIHLDQTWGPEWLEAFKWYEGSSPEAARAQLTVVSSAMITVSSTLFAITIAAVAFASGNYGPRLLTNFMNDRGNQVSLGVFIATFVFNLLVLRVVRDSKELAAATEQGVEAASAFVPQLSMLVSGVSVIIAVAVLVYFLHHIPASIRINTVLGGIGQRLVRDIETRFPVEGGSLEPGEEERGETLVAAEIGYIEIIDFQELDKVAAREGLKIVLKVRTGDFIHPHLPVVEIIGGSPDDKLKDGIRDCFSLGFSRTPAQDLEFLIDELVEIGLRALSPGINDPFTAVTAMHWMAAALAKLADRSLNEGPEQKNYDPDRVRPIPDDFGHYVARSFGGIRTSAATNPIAAKIFLDALAGVTLGANSPSRRDALIEQGRQLLRQAESSLEGPALEEVRSRMDEFERNCAEVAS